MLETNSSTWTCFIISLFWRISYLLLIKTRICTFVQTKWQMSISPVLIYNDFFHYLMILSSTLLASDPFANRSRAFRNDNKKKKAARILKQNVSLICVNSSTKDGVMGETQTSLTEKEEILEVNELQQAGSHPAVALFVIDDGVRSLSARIDLAAIT